MGYQRACGWVLVLAAFGAAAPDPGRAPAAPAPPAAAPSPVSPAYAIKFTRPVKVGERHRYVADATVVNSINGSYGGRESSLKPIAVTVHFQAVERVLAVNAQGEPTKAEYTVESCIARRERGKEIVVLKPWRVLTVESGPWKSRLQLDQGTLTLAEEMLLRYAVSLPNLKGVTADDCFGTARPQRVGDSWPVNADALARSASQKGATLNKQQVSGTVKLKAVQMVDGVPHLLVTGKAVFERWPTDPLDLPKGTHFVGGTREVKFTRLLPVDPGGHCLTDFGSDRVVSKLKSDDEGMGPDLQAESNILKTVGIKRTPLPAPAIASGQE